MIQENDSNVPYRAPLNAFKTVQKYQLVMLTKAPQPVVYQLTVKTRAGVIVSQWTQDSLASGLGGLLAQALLSESHKPQVNTVFALQPGVPRKNLGKVLEAAWRLETATYDIRAQATLASGTLLYLHFPRDIAASLLAELSLTATLEGTLSND